MLLYPESLRTQASAKDLILIPLILLHFISSQVITLFRFYHENSLSFLKGKETSRNVKLPPRNTAHYTTEVTIEEVVRGDAAIRVRKQIVRIVAIVSHRQPRAHAVTDALQNAIPKKLGF